MSSCAIKIHPVSGETGIMVKRALRFNKIKVTKNETKLNGNISIQKFVDLQNRKKNYFKIKLKLSEEKINL